MIAAAGSDVNPCTHFFSSWPVEQYLSRKQGESRHEDVHDTIVLPMQSPVAVRTRRRGRLDISMNAWYAAMTRYYVTCNFRRSGSLN